MASRVGVSVERKNKNSFIYFLLLVAAVALLSSIFFSNGSNQVKNVTPNQVAEWVNEGKVQSIVVSGERIEITTTDKKQYISRKEENTDFISTLLSLGVPKEKLTSFKLEVQKPNDINGWVNLLGWVLPLLFIGFLFVMFTRQAQGANNQALSFGKSRARMIAGNRPNVTFDDVAGAEEAKEELKEVVEFLREPQKFLALGARIPKGVLMVGPPGTGKTLMAKAVAGEAGVPFFSISGSEFVEMFVGVGASRVRDLFDQAKKNAPSIIFIDEIDAVGRHRGAGLGGSHDEREQTLNQILVEMDGFETDTSVIVIAATNRPDILDPALLRPGRFDRRVVLDRPDMRGRLAILKVHTRGKPLSPDVDLEVLARSTPGFVGADIENLVNEAAILAARRGKHAIGMDEFTEAIERVIAGPERKSRLISQEEKRIIAYHEAGHAIVRHMLPLCDPVRKISIVSRGMALGYTLSLPEDDKVLYSRNKFEQDLAAILGGRAAEEIVFGDITTGASDDLEKATKLARNMVTVYGMSERLGPMQFGRRDELVFLGKEISEQRDYSEETAQEIDEEVERIVYRAYNRAKAILSTYRNKLDAVAQRLIEVETLEAPEFEAFFQDVLDGRPSEVPAPA